MLTGRIFLANVGSNSGHRFSSPVFDDGTFEFLPIPEDRDLDGDHAVRYRDLRPYNRPVRDLLQYVPGRLWDWPAHNDPEFDTFTYGDNCSTSPRAAALRRVEPGDVRRGLSDSKLWDRFWVSRGSARSRRFDRAVPVTRDLAGRVLTSADSSPWRWDNGRSDLQVIGSYTRSCRCVIDPARPGHAMRAEALWDSVSEYAS